MIWIALSAVVALGLFGIATLKAIEHLMRAHGRERTLLINQILHATGNTWTPPPAEPRAERPEPEPRGYQTAPEQHHP